MRRLAREEGGFTLVFALLTLLTTSAMLVSVVSYTGSNERQTERSSVEVKAYSLAEAGINNAMAVLANPANNALSAAIMPTTEAAAKSATWNFTAAYSGGTATWWGTFNSTTSVWTIWGLGEARSAVPGQEPTRRLLSATSQVLTSFTQPLNVRAWNYVYSLKTGDPDGCDLELVNATVNQAPLYVVGNLCLMHTASIRRGAHPVSVVVKGPNGIKLTTNDNFIGTTSARVDDVQSSGGCKLRAQAVNSPCGTTDNVHAVVSGTTPPTADPPIPDFAYWYENAALGPKAPCTSSTGTPPTFDDTNTVRDGNQPSFNLTPATSYTCSRGAARLDWNATTRVLTVAGPIYIDGPLTIANNAVNTYTGQGTIYTTKSLTIGNSTKLCVVVSAGRRPSDDQCNFSGAWNPNTNMLVFAAEGMGLTTGILIQNEAQMQGALYGKNVVELKNEAKYEGPIVAGEVKIENTTTFHAFPAIDTVPVGTPGTPNTYAVPQKPTNFSG